jgi:hypothetical protein
MVDRDGQIGEASPAIRGDRVRIDARCVPAGLDEPADRHDLAGGDRGRHLGTRLRERRVAVPGRDRAAHAETQ